MTSALFVTRQVFSLAIFYIYICVQMDKQVSTVLRVNNVTEAFRTRPKEPS